MNNIYFQSLHEERKKLLSVFRELQFSSLQEDIPHTQIIPYASYSPWKNDADFRKVYERIKSFTLVDEYRCFELWSLVRQVLTLPGDVLEVGVWRGGTAAVLANAVSGSPDTKLYLCDTFQGVVKAGNKDTNYTGGEHSDTSEQIVVDLLESFDLSNFYLRKGIFPDDFNDEFLNVEIKFCHIDVDTYSSAKDILEYVWKNLVKRGMVVFDDYGFWGCEGITKYFNELDLPGSYKIHNLNGHGILIK